MAIPSPHALLTLPTEDLAFLHTLVELVVLAGQGGPTRALVHRMEAKQIGDRMATLHQACHAVGWPTTLHKRGDVPVILSFHATGTAHAPFVVAGLTTIWAETEGMGAHALLFHHTLLHALTAALDQKRTTPCTAHA